MAITHAFVSAKADGADTSLVRASNWNANHSGEVARATQASLEAETNETTYVSPDKVRNCPGVAKVWCSITAPGALSSPSYNVASVTDTGVGDRTIVIDTDFSTATFIAVGSVIATSLSELIEFNTFAVGSVRFVIGSATTGIAADFASTQAFFGDQ